jgi:Ni,Fe-hydrogenase III component G
MTSLDQAQHLLAEYAQDWQTPEENRLDAHVTPDSLLGAVETLRDHQWGYLAAITGLDGWPASAEMEILYHFCAGPAVLTLRVRVPREQAAVPSICAPFPYASVFERELREMFGLEVLQTPDPTRLFLPDDWPEGVYPLRKDAQLD